VAEVAIPGSIVNTTNLNNLATAKVLQPFSSILPRIPNNPSSMSTGGYEAIGGLMVSGGQLIGTAFNTYDGSGSAVDSHFVLNSLNLASAKISGLYQVGDLGGGFVGGYMTPVPSEWQSTLGAPDLTGQAALNIISRTSFGPAAFGFDPSQLGSGVTPDIPYVYYDQNHTNLGTYGSNPPTLFNGTVGGSNLTGLGVAFVPGTRSVLFFGAIGTGSFYYGEAAAANDPNRTSKGPHSVGGNYVYQVWAYDANDFAAVRSGQKNPWDLKPYATWNFDFPEQEGSKFIGGVAFDPSTMRLYVSQLNADTSSQYTYNPLIQVFQVTMNSSAMAADQPVATSSASPAVTSPVVTASSMTAARPAAAETSASSAIMIGIPGSAAQAGWTFMPIGGGRTRVALDASNRVSSSPRPRRFQFVPRPGHSSMRARTGASCPGSPHESAPSAPLADLRGSIPRLASLWGRSRRRRKHCYGIPRTIGGPINRVIPTGRCCQTRIMRRYRGLSGRMSVASPARR
jgi:hypothetical protein